MLRKTISFFILIVMFAVTGIVTMSGCSRNQETLTWTEVISDIRDKYPDVRQLRTDELHSWLTGSRSKFIILIDARAKEEFRVSHITGAMNIPHNSKDPLKYLTNIKPENPIIVYCSVGYRSSILAGKLQDMGFTRVYNLEGSIFKWANEGRPLVQGKVTVREVHPYDTRWGNLLERKYHVDVD